MGSDEEARKRLATQTAYPTSLAKPTLRRQTPKVGAVCPNRARTGSGHECSGGQAVVYFMTDATMSWGAHAKRAFLDADSDQPFNNLPYANPDAVKLTAPERE